MNIDDIIIKIDLNLLKEQSCLVESLITERESDFNEAITDEVAERLAIDVDNLKGLLELLDNLICCLDV